MLLIYFLVLKMCVFKLSANQLNNIDRSLCHLLQSSVPWNMLWVIFVGYVFMAKTAVLRNCTLCTFKITLLIYTPPNWTVI